MLTSFNNDKSYRVVFHDVEVFVERVGARRRQDARVAIAETPEISSQKGKRKRKKATKKV